MLWAAIGLLVHLAFVALLLGRAHGHPDYFVEFGSRAPSYRLAQDRLGAQVTVRNEFGQDGKEFWVLAHDPLLLRGRSYGRYLDRPAYRAQRMLYPALASPWRFGGEQALLWGLLATNLAAVFVGGYVASRLALDLGGRAWAGLAFAVNPAVLFAVRKDASDAVALAALLGVVWMVRRTRTGLAMVLAAAATLAKEPSLLAIAGICLFARDIGRRSRIALFGVSALAAGAWALYARWREEWLGTGVREFALPFTGFVKAMQEWSGSPARVAFDAAGALALLAVAIVVMVRWWRHPSVVLAAALPFAALVPVLSKPVLLSGTDSLRAIAPAITFVALDVLSRSWPVSPRGDR